MKNNKDLVEKWYSKNYSDIIGSCWIDDDLKCTYKNLICKAFKEGIKYGSKQILKK